MTVITLEAVFPDGETYGGEEVRVEVVSGNQRPPHDGNRHIMGVSSFRMPTDDTALAMDLEPNAAGSVTRVSVEEYRWWIQVPESGGPFDINDEAIAAEGLPVPGHVEVGTQTIGTVEQVAIGEQPYVENVGTPRNAIWNYGFPASLDIADVPVDAAGGVASHAKIQRFAYTPEDHGAVGDGVTDDQAAIQAAIDAAHAIGGNVYISRTHLVGSSLLHKAGVTIYGPGTLLRGWSSSVPVTQAVKWNHAVIRQETTSAGSPDIGMSLRDVRVESNGHTGPLIAYYYVEDLAVANIVCDYTGAGDWCLTVWGGKRVTIDGPQLYGGVDIYEDGCHIAGNSEYVTMTGLVVESGDDMVALTTVAGETMSHIACKGLVGKSQSGFAFKCYAESGSVIEHVVADLTAYSGVLRNGIISLDSVGAGGVRHVQINGTGHTGTSATTVNPYGVWLRNCFDVSGTVTVENPRRHAARIEGCELISMTINSPEGPQEAGAYATVYVITSNQVRISGTIAGGALTPVRFTTCDDAYVDGATLFDVPNAGNAVQVETTCGRVGLRNSTVSLVSGGTACHGLRITTASGATSVIVEGNDFTAAGSGCYGLYPANIPAAFSVLGNTGQRTANYVAPPTATIAAGILTTAYNPVTVAGEGAAADDLVTFRTVTGGAGQKGMTVVLHRGSQDITIKHGTGNIKTRSGADTVMTSSANTVVALTFDGTNWVQT